MPLDFPLCCQCGQIRGVAHGLAPSGGFRFVCYCRHCQTFARFLNRPDVLNAAGGTDILQLPPARVQLTTGKDALRCLSFSGRVLRWYAACCRTPIGNTATGPRFPIVALIHSFFDDAAAGRSREELLGPPRCRIYEGSAIGPLPSSTPAPASFGTLARRASMLLGWWMRGLAQPNPFFDPLKRVPLSAPRMLASNERAAPGSG